MTTDASTPETAPNPFDELMATAREGIGLLVPALVRHLSDLEGRIAAVEGQAQKDVSADVAQLKSDLSTVKSQLAGVISAITIPADQRPTLPGPPPALGSQGPQA